MSVEVPEKAVTSVRLDLFSSQGLDRGRSRWIEALWYLCKCLFFLSALPWPSGFKSWLLRKFGASVGRGVVIKPRVNVHLPWKLELGDHVWLGEEVFILNLERVSIGSHCCVSQRAFLCTGNHDYRDASFHYRNAPITIEDGVWIGAQTFVAPGVRIRTDTVVEACSKVVSDLPAGMVCGGNPAKVAKARWNKR